MLCADARLSAGCKMLALVAICWTGLAASAAGQEVSLPLPAFLKDAIFARERAEVFEAVPSGVGTGGFTAVAEAQQGTFLGYVRSGFVAQFARKQSNDGLTATIPVPLGTASIVYLRPNAFNILGRPSPAEKWRTFNNYGSFPSPSAMRPYKVTPYTELLDPLNAKDVTLTNVTGNIADAYQLVAGGSPANGLLPGLVKTASGYFIGYLRERSPFSGSRLTWSQVVKAQGWKYRLRVVQTMEISRNAKIFGLADFAKQKRALFLTDNPDNARIAPVLYEPLLQTGMAGIAAELDAPKDDGLERPAVASAEPPGKNDGKVPKEVVLNSVTVRFLDWNEASTQLAVEYDQQERTVARDIQTGRMDPGPWQKHKLMKNVSVQNDPDGGIRFTDRNYIYEITKERFATKFNTYRVEQTPLRN